LSPLSSMKSKILKAEARDLALRRSMRFGLGSSALLRGNWMAFRKLQREHSELQIKTLSLAIVDALNRALRLRDPSTERHGRRVAETACAMALELQWSDDRILGLRLAALLHDIGKISIPTEILNKSGPLRDVEWAMIKEHPATGYEILKDIPFSWPIAMIVQQHHERLDGSGYPLGARGDEILPEAKILAVADVVDAMISVRPYRAPAGVETALQQVEQCAGTLFDPDVVRIYTNEVRSGRLVISA
jgi:putative nucleotidyltransferase with HDIG domain